MVEIAKKVLEFLVVFLLVYGVTYVFTIPKIKKYDRKKASTGVKYLIYKYNIDVVKIGYKEISKKLVLFDSLIIAFIYIVTSIVDNIYIRLLVAFILVFPMFAGVYHLIGTYYKKKDDE